MGLAYLIPIRQNSENGSEVLLAQNHVIDYQSTFERAHLRIYDNPGEITCIGGVIKTMNVMGEPTIVESPAYAALRCFCEEALIPRPQTAILYSFQVVSENIHYFICTAEENPWLRLVSDDALFEKNLFFAERDAKLQTALERGVLPDNWSWRSYSRIHKLAWMRLRSEDGLRAPEWCEAWRRDQYSLVHRIALRYPQYRLVQVFNNERIIPVACDSVLRKLDQNPILTNVQVYLDADRTRPVLLNGKGGIENGPDITYLKIRDYNQAAPPSIGEAHFVIAFKGANLVLLQRMWLIEGPVGGYYTFGSRSLEPTIG